MPPEILSIKREQNDITGRKGTSLDDDREAYLMHQAYKLLCMHEAPKVLTGFDLGQRGSIFYSSPVSVPINLSTQSAVIITVSGSVTAATPINPLAGFATARYDSCSPESEPPLISQAETVYIENWDVKKWYKQPNPYELNTHWHNIETLPIDPRIEKRTSIAEWIDFIKELPDIQYSKHLAERIEYLISVSEEDFPEQEPMACPSLCDFVNFIVSHKNINYPDVILTYTGNIRSQWRKASNKHFAVEFMGDGNISFVIFAPDSDLPYKTNRVAGETTIESLFKIVEPYGVFNWMLKEEREAA